MWRRALAFLIDLFPIFLLAGIENAMGIAEHPLAGLLNLVVFLGYFSGMNYRWGGTIGKRMLGLRIALPASPDVFPRLIARALIKLICLFPPLATVYGLIAIWRQDGRSLADFAVGSTVVNAGTLTPPNQQSVFGRIIASLLILFSPWIFMTLLMLACFGWVLADNWEELAPFVMLMFEDSGSCQ